MYIPKDPPLVLYMLSSCQEALTPVLSPHILAKVRLPGIQTRALRISVSQTLYQLS